MAYVWIRADNWDNSVFEFKVLVCELVGQGRDYKAYVAPIVKIAGAEKAGSELAS